MFAGTGDAIAENATVGQVLLLRSPTRLIIVLLVPLWRWTSLASPRRCVFTLSARSMHRRPLDASRHRRPLAAGEWAYHCIGPVDALIELAKGAGRNLSPGEVGARTTELIEAMLRSARQGGGVVTGLAAGGETFPVA